MPARVVIYRTRFCPYCELAARFLRERNIGFIEIDVSSDAEKRRWLLEATNRRTVPQIFINDQPIGGFVDLVELDRREQLEALVGRAAAEPLDPKRP